MSSLTAALPATYAAFQQQPWKAWSIPLDPLRMRRELCGLLNKVSKSTVDSVADRIARIAISVEKTGDPQVLDSFVRDVLDRGISDAPRSELIVGICQRIVDELEGERTLWRKVDLFHLGNPMECFETSLRLLSQYEFDRLVENHEGEERLFTYATFIGLLLVEGILYPTDVHGILDVLFNGVHIHEGYVVAICRFLTPLVNAFNASQLLEPLLVAERIEGLLQEDTISLRTRYLMMNMLDQIIYPRPRDAFASTRQRIEVYGLDAEDSSDLGSAATEERTMDANEIYDVCVEHARELLSSRQVAPAEQFFRKLNPEDRHLFISSLVSFALTSGGIEDASLVASLLYAIRELCEYDNCLTQGFESTIASLEDTLLDVPLAVDLVSIMLHSSLDRYTVEDLLSNLSLNTTIKNRLLEAYYALDQSSVLEAHASASQSEGENDEDFGSDEGLQSGFAHAY